MKLPNKTLEHKLLNRTYDFVIGVDEVGMGCLAGPVVVCAVMLDKQFFGKRYPKLKGIRDSKLLNASQREILATKLRRIPGFHYRLTYCHPKTIDRINIYQASRVAMRRSIKNLELSIKGKIKTPNSQFLIPNSIILVDGNKKIPGLNLPQLAIIKGDRKVFSIACASIVAKVHRDRMMTRYASKYPDYGFEKHKGYGTKLHQAMLTAFGPTPIHRRSFRLEY